MIRSAHLPHGFALLLRASLVPLRVRCKVNPPLQPSCDRQQRPLVGWIPGSPHNIEGCTTQPSTLNQGSSDRGAALETAFKIGFLIALFSLLAAVRRVARELRRRPSATVNQMANEVRVLKIIRPTLGLIFYAALFDWLLPGTRIAWAAFEASPALRWIGVAVCFASVAVIWWCFATLGPNYRGGVGLWDDHELVTAGPYSVVRHPIYTGFIALMLGIWAASASWLVGASGFLLTLSVPVFRLRIEELELRQRFTMRYAEYEQSTPRFFPRVFSPRKSGGST